MIRQTFKILITHPEVPKPAIDFLRQTCEVVLCNNVPPQKSDILAKVMGVDGILWAHTDPLNAEVFDAAGKSLKAISTMTSGVDYVDIAELKKRSIRLGNTTGVVSDAVAEIAIGLMIAACRRFHEGRRIIETSTWETNHLEWMFGKEIRGSTIGFFGFGGIGQAIASRLKCFQTGQILYTTRSRIENEKEFQAKHIGFDELLKESDIIFVSCPLTKETRNVFDAAAFGKMKSNAVLVNVARGQIIDQPALIEALTTNQIFAAGLDVMTPEPLPNTDPLLNLPNCVVIPHLGTATLETTTEMAMLAAKNILGGLNGGTMPSEI